MAETEDWAMKPTEGPYKVDSDGQTIWGKDRSVPIADVRRLGPVWYSGPPLPTEANARLLAKSWEMREALKGCRQYLCIAAIEERNAGRKTTEAIAKKDLATLDALLASIDGNSQ